MGASPRICRDFLHRVGLVPCVVKSADRTKATPSLTCCFKDSVKAHLRSFFSITIGALIVIRHGRRIKSVLVTEQGYLWSDTPYMLSDDGEEERWMSNLWEAEKHWLRIMY